MSLSFLFDESKWINDYIDVDFFENRIGKAYDPSIPLSERLKTLANSGVFTPTLNLTWHRHRIHRKEAIKSMHYIGAYLRNRNYSLVHDTYEKNDLHIPYLRPKGYSQAMETHPTSPDRNLDPTEEMFRRMSLGQVTKAMYDRSKEFLKFYVDCGRFL